jgi:hypothetical protein
MPEQKRRKPSEAVGDTHDFEYQRHRVRIEQPGGARPRLEEGVQEARLYIDDEEIPIEVTERGVLSHEMAFKEYGTVDELAEDIIRQRGTAEIVKGEVEHHDHEQPPKKPEQA